VTCSTDERRTRWKLAAREGFGEQEFRAANEKMKIADGEAFERKPA
jgi:hypothetical protein